MTELEVEAEVATITTETINVCDDCGTEVEADGDDALELHINPDPTCEISSFDAHFIGASRGTSDTHDISDMVTLNSEGAIHLHRECFESVFVTDHHPGDYSKYRDDTDTDTGDDDEDGSGEWEERSAALWHVLFGGLCIPLVLAGGLPMEIVGHGGDIPAGDRGYLAGILATLLWVGGALVLFGVIP